MPIVIPPGFAYVRVSITKGTTGRLMSNGHGVDLATPLTQTEVNALSTNLAGTYKPILSTGSLYNGIHIEEGQDGAPLVWDSVSGAGAGTRTITASTTPQVQLLCDKKTALGGRKFRGRTFLPDVAESDVNDAGAVAAGTVTLLTTFCTNLLTNFSTGAYAGMVVLHSDATVPTPVTTMSADGKAATLRARYKR